MSLIYSSVFVCDMHTKWTGIGKAIKGLSFFPNDMSGLILDFHQANERCRYKVMLSLIGWAQT